MASFSVGQLVCLAADPSRLGPVTQVLVDSDGPPRYRVFHSQGLIREYDEEQLVACDERSGGDALVDAFRAREWLSPREFVARLAAARLAHPLVDTLYSMQAARIRHVPFQYKPLIRFLRADRPRLLVADDVGVGKTIEAGLILKELEARGSVENVLVLCPKPLVSKWQSEMRRFDESFRVMGSRELRYCIHESHLDGAWPREFGRAIVHLELMRAETYLEGDAKRRRPGLLELDPAPHFDLLIVDEAHHLRNPDTRSHALARFLSDVSEAVLFLSATPVHLGAENLYTLLNLLRPDLFASLAAFNDVIAPNQFITAAMRSVRAGEAGWPGVATAELRSALQTPWGQRALADDPRLTDWLEKLDSGHSASDDERVRLLRDLEEAHSLAHVMNRTRRKDIGPFTTREPHTVSIDFSPQQRVLYEALIEYRRQVLLLKHEPIVVRLILDTLERQAASCLPALLPTIDALLGSGGLSNVTDDVEDEGDGQAAPPDLVSATDQLRVAAESHALDEDPKCEALAELVAQTMSGDGPGKLLVFSFFLNTIAYLQKRLSAQGVRVAVVTGRVPDEERERLRDRFRLPRPHPDAIDVLLSSEVGTEGLDYEFCDRLVNYDIPWNPMRIEQRIGRIDRFGQKAPKVLIFNFVTPGTIEERIFFRCFERLGVFRDTVGDLEEVLGEVMQDLSRAAMDPRLSSDQAESAARQTADNAIRRVEEQRRLEEAGEGLLGLDRALIDEADRALAEGRFVSASELRLLLDFYLGGPSRRGRLSPIAERPGVFRLKLGQDGRAEVISDLRRLGAGDRAALLLERALDASEDPILTFDQELAADQRDLLFMTPVHPLVRAARAAAAAEPAPITTGLSVKDDAVPSGLYGFACDLWDVLAARPENRMVCVAVRVSDLEFEPEVSAALPRLLGRAGPQSLSKDAEGPPEGLINRLDRELRQRRAQALAHVRERNDVLVGRQLASVDAYYENRQRRAHEELAASTAPTIIRMKEAELARLERELAARRANLELGLRADIVSERVALGLLEVVGGG